MSLIDAASHVRGESLYVDDIPVPAGTLYAVPAGSRMAHARLTAIHTEDARNFPGIVCVLTADDIPGQNQIGTIIMDEPLLAEDCVHYVGQPFAVVVGTSRMAAEQAAKRISADYTPLPAIFDAREAASAGQFIAPSRTFACGDLAKAWEKCVTILENRVDSGSQEHLYIETQGSIAFPAENDSVRLISGTQSPTSTQKVVARILGIPMTKVEVDIRRLGGAFGGKEDQATPWAAMAALAARRTQKTVKLILNRHDDMHMTGKRHPYSSDYKIGLDAEGRILAYEVDFYQNAGAAADLSTSILDRSLYHALNVYHIPNVRITGYSCRTNLPPFTAFRGFGAPQAVFVIESALTHAAAVTGIDKLTLQARNFIQSGQTFHYGQTLPVSHAGRALSECLNHYQYPELQTRVRHFNAQHYGSKKGLSVLPICFGISFTTIFLNQASALIHVYTDGSVSVSTGAVEMGQGVYTKIARVCARTLGISSERITILSTNTTRVANTSPTAASTGADLNGMATFEASRLLVSRLLDFAALELSVPRTAVTLQNNFVCVSDCPTELTWDSLIAKAYLNRICLTQHAFYATPDLAFDRTTETGSPFAYHVFGAAITEVTLDTLTGAYTIDSVKIVHDAGESLDRAIDCGQIEGGLVQGLGWMTLEEIQYGAEGQLLSGSLATYKVPDLHFAPAIEVRFLEQAPNPRAVLNSKAVGEPPFLYGMGAYFALLEALQAAQPEKPVFFTAPMTPERTLLYLMEPSKLGLPNEDPALQAMHKTH